MKRIASFFFLLLIPCLVAAEQAREPLKLGVLAYRPKPQVIAQWQPVADYLHSALARPVELAAYNHAEISAAVEQRAVDVVITTANQFILLQHNYKLSSPLATLILHEGQNRLNTYGSAIISLSNRDDIASLADLSGKRIAVVSKKAFGGYQIPSLELVEAGISMPEETSLLITGQPHDRVVSAVLEGRADAGFIRAGMLESLAAEGKLDLGRFKVINRQQAPGFPYMLSTRLYPEWPVAVMPHIDQTLASQLAATLFLMPPEIMEGSTLNLFGFGVPANYDVVENLLRRLRLPPFDRAPEIGLPDLWRQYNWWIVTLATLLLLFVAASLGLVVMVRRSRNSLHELAQMAENEKLVLSSLTEGVYGIDPQGLCIFINPRALTILGLSEEEVIGKDSHALFHAHGDEATNSVQNCPVHMALHDGEKRELEDRFVHKDGREIPVWMGVSVMSKGAEILGAVVVFQDISERKQAEQSLRKSERRFRSYFELPLIGIAITSLEKGWLEYNDRLCDILGYSRNELKGLTWVEITHPDDVAGDIAEFDKVLAGRQEGYSLEKRFIRKDGSIVYAEISARCVRDDDGQAEYFVVLVQDISERKRAEAALRESESELRKIIETAREGIWVLDTEAMTVSVNARMAELLGYEAAEMIGLPMGAFMFEADIPDHKKKMQARRLGLSESYERSFRRKDGQAIWVVVSATPIYDEEQNYNGSFAMVTDITERKQNEAVNAARLHLIQFSLNHSLPDLLEETLNQAEKLTGSRIGFYHFVDEDQENLTLQAWSTQTKAVFCKAEGEGMHYPIADAGVWVDCVHERKTVIHNDYASLPHRKGMPEGHAEVVRELVVPVFRGDRIAAILGVGNKPAEYTEKDVEVVSLVADLAWEIAERKRIENELERYHHSLEELVRERTEELRLARDAAEAANSAKSAFLANMSHELRTPLSAILGFSQLMRRDEGLDPSQQNSLDIINNSGKHLLKLINDVLEIAKIEAGRMHLDIATFDLHELVREVTEMMRLRAKQKGLYLELDQSSEFPRYIKGDEARLRQILVNLVSNAVKFTEQGGVTIRLGVKERARHHLVIEVQDTGPGISKQDQQRLFKPFVQLTSGEARGGTGLGLSIVRQFVQLMGGSVGVESTADKGAVFRVELPLEEAEESEVKRLGSEVSGEIIGLQPGQPVYRILIVEDQHDNQLLLRKLMVDLGQDVQVADNGEACIELFKKWKPDLIWMDRRMPVMGGEEATRRIRKLPGGDQVKIIAVTASAFKEEHARMIAAGMDGVVRKPYRFSEIYDSMAKQLGLRFLYAETEMESPAEKLDPERLADLPEALRVELREAVESLEVNAIAQALQHIGEHDPELEKSLTRIVESLDYPAILQALDDAAHIP